MFFSVSLQQSPFNVTASILRKFYTRPVCFYAKGKVQSVFFFFFLFLGCPSEKQPLRLGCQSQMSVVLGNQTTVFPSCEKLRVVDLSPKLLYFWGHISLAAALDFHCNIQ